MKTKHQNKAWKEAHGTPFSESFSESCLFASSSLLVFYHIHNMWFLFSDFPSRRSCSQVGVIDPVILVY